MWYLKIAVNAAGLSRHWAACLFLCLLDSVHYSNVPWFFSKCLLYGSSFLCYWASKTSVHWTICLLERQLLEMSQCSVLSYCLFWKQKKQTPPNPWNCLLSKQRNFIKILYFQLEKWPVAYSSSCSVQESLSKECGLFVLHYKPVSL